MSHMKGCDRMHSRCLCDALEMAEEVDALRARVAQLEAEAASVAERQREACAKFIETTAYDEDDMPLYAGDVRKTPLVTGPAPVDPRVTRLVEAARKSLEFERGPSSLMTHEWEELRAMERELEEALKDFTDTATSSRTPSP